MEEAWPTQPYLPLLERISDSPRPLPGKNEISMFQPPPPRGPCSLTHTPDSDNAYFGERTSP